jgi:hypothetical protein
MYLLSWRWSCAVSVWQTLSLYAGLKGVPITREATEVRDMIRQLQLEDKAHADVGTLSGGMKRKLCVALALIGGSKVVFLVSDGDGVIMVVVVVVVVVLVVIVVVVVVRVRETSMCERGGWHVVCASARLVASACVHLAVVRMSARLDATPTRVAASGSCCSPTRPAAASS